MSHSFLPPLTDDHAYGCPLCRYGQLSPLTLMDAFTCNFCRHIFTPNLQNQTLQLADSDRPLTWYWTGKHWQRVGTDQDNPSTGLLIVFSGAIAILPGSLIGLAYYIFPPDPHSIGATFPLYWTGLTFLGHLILVAWLWIEYTQWPLYQALKIRLQELLRS